MAVEPAVALEFGPLLVLEHAQCETQTKTKLSFVRERRGRNGQTFMSS